MPQYDVQVNSIDAQPTLTRRFRAKTDELGAKLSEVLPAVFQHAMSQGCRILGQPFSRYHTFDQEAGIFDVEAGLPVERPVAGPDGIEPGELPAGAAATTLHVGPYEQLGGAHDALANWAREHGKRPTGGAWEVYVTDPGNEPDPQKWQTQLFLPIE